MDDFPLGMIGLKAWMPDCMRLFRSCGCSMSRPPSASISATSGASSTGKKVRGTAPCSCRYRGPLVLNLSSHHGDGTPGTAVVVFTDDLEGLHAELKGKGFPFMSPGIELHGVGREMALLDPASNQIRFFQRDQS
jgi:Glyoxalase superfamily protein